MGWVGLEPTTNALKGRCSTIELPTLGKRSGTVSLKRIVASGFEHHATENGAVTRGRVVPIANAKIPRQQLRSIRKPAFAGRRQTIAQRHLDERLLPPCISSSLSKKGWAGAKPAQRV